jgi:hypothetical protein
LEAEFAVEGELVLPSDVWDARHLLFFWHEQCPWQRVWKGFRQVRLQMLDRQHRFWVQREIHASITQDVLRTMYIQRRWRVRVFLKEYCSPYLVMVLRQEPLSYQLEYSFWSQVFRHWFLAKRGHALATANQI